VSGGAEARVAFQTTPPRAACGAALVSLPSPFTFRTASGTETSHELASLAAPGHVAYDVRALAARVLLRPPTRIGETPYLGRLAVRVVPPPAEVSAEPAPPTPEEAARTLRRALERAVDRALEGTKCVAVMTGGGVDSSALLALAVRRARRTGGAAFGIALDFEGPGDDRPHREALAAHLGCEIMRVRPEDAAHRFATLARGVDATPVTWPGAAMEVEMLARARAHGAEVALMGVGADELFDGDPRALAGLARAGHVRDALTTARTLRGFAAPTHPTLQWIARPLVAAALPRAWRRRRARRTAAAGAPVWAGGLLRDHARAWQHDDLERSLDPPRDAAGRYARFDGSPSHEHLAWLRHQEQMASGLERRDPYLDRELARFVTALPPSWLLHGGVRRGLFREAVRGLVPESIRLREDKASFEPAFRRFVDASGGFSMLQPLVRMRELGALGLVDPPRFRDAFTAFCAAPDEGWGDVWPALLVESFLVARREGRAGP
jgi:asparagine synthetase B (glutamine-hydrolysing)